MPIFALTFKMKADYDELDWYAMGPEENYADRCHGARLMRFRNRVADNVASIWCRRNRATALVFGVSILPMRRAAAYEFRLRTNSRSNAMFRRIRPSSWKMRTILLNCPMCIIRSSQWPGAYLASAVMIAGVRQCMRSIAFRRTASSNLSSRYRLYNSSMKRVSRSLSKRTFGHPF